MDAELKPCPFCGGRAWMDPATTFHRIECRGCEARTKLFADPRVAKDAWNRRSASPAGKSAEVEEALKWADDADEVSRMNNPIHSSSKTFPAILAAEVRRLSHPRVELSEEENRALTFARVHAGLEDTPTEDDARYLQVVARLCRRLLGESR